MAEKGQNNGSGEAEGGQDAGGVGQDGGQTGETSEARPQTGTSGGNKAEND